MRQRLTIILTFVVIIGLLVILNSLTYVRKEKIEDMEIVPNRSTYHLDQPARERFTICSTSQATKSFAGASLPSDCLVRTVN